LTSRRIASALRGLLTAALLAGPIQAATAEGLSGAYLAATQADFRDDYIAAADYYRRALVFDPGNLAMLQNAAVAEVAAGDMATAASLAGQLVEKVPGSPIAILVIMADALARGDFDAAEAVVDKAGPEANPLLTGLIGGWIAAGRDDFTEAQRRFDAMDANEALSVYGRYHKALALALAGDFVTAQTILAGGEAGPLHLSRGAIVAHAQILAQLDRTDAAIALLDEALAGGFPDATLVDLRRRLAAGEDVPFTQVTRAQDGAAEAFLTMAEGLNTPESGRLAIVYARLALLVRPDLTEAALVAADALAREGQFALATEALDGVAADSPWFVTAQIRRAATQRDAGDPDAAIVTLQALAQSHGDQLEVEAALADHLRMAERFPEAAAAYSAAIEIAGVPPQPVHWGLYYSRAISNERAGEWAKAEADFREALTLQPDQPMVQNYLGYSLVEQQGDLDEALGLIEAAVSGEPDNGYITDSLGWVLYRLGRYDEAVPHMLRAVELEPVDPVINDHLGDVLWKVGRKREASFQWKRALSFGPAEDLDMDRVRRKLDVGLDAVLTDEKTKNGG
jgi:tetratricopeptide (TPR) repeat protein